MCTQCDYTEMLNASNLEPFENRLRILEIVGNNKYPLSAADIFNTMEREKSVNRVTVYRILDLLVEKRILERLSTGGRAFYYGLAPNPNHKRHPHFYCKICGQMDCLDPEILEVNTEAFIKNFPGRIDKLEIRLDGICKNCLRLME